MSLLRTSWPSRVRGEQYTLNWGSWRLLFSFCSAKCRSVGGGPKVTAHKNLSNSLVLTQKRGVLWGEISRLSSCQSVFCEGRLHRRSIWFHMFDINKESALWVCLTNTASLQTNHYFSTISGPIHCNNKNIKRLIHQNKKKIFSHLLQAIGLYTHTGSAACTCELY